MPLTSSQTRYLRGLAHHLKPVLMIGQKGLTETVLAELDNALAHHELIKVTIAAERDERQQITIALCQHSNAELIQMIGKVSVLYRSAKEPKIALPK